MKQAKIFNALVFHKRFFPKINQFNYGAFYVALPLSHLNNPVLRSALNIDQRGLVSFQTKDHGALDGSSLEHWFRGILKNHDLNEITFEIVLVTMPRFLNFVFNPVSFWLALDENAQIRAVLCEVNNTFNETHSYLCFHSDKRVITAKDELFGEKMFHVSPFLAREGYYQFQFHLGEDSAHFVVDFYNPNGKKQLVTSLKGKLKKLTKAEVYWTFLKNPLTTFKVIFLIHWQALKLLIKGIKYIPKPKAKDEKITLTQD